MSVFRRQPCRVCGVEFVALRTGALTCGPACRQARSRIRRQVAEQIERNEQIERTATEQTWEKLDTESAGG